MTRMTSVTLIRKKFLAYGFYKSCVLCRYNRELKDIIISWVDLRHTQWRKEETGWFLV